MTLQHPLTTMYITLTKMATVAKYLESEQDLYIHGTYMSQIAAIVQYSTYSLNHSIQDFWLKI